MTRVQISLGSVALLALTMCSTTPERPAPPPLPPPPAALQTAPAGPSPAVACMASARSGYPGIEWELFSMSSQPYEHRGVAGTLAGVDGTRGEAGYRYRCFHAPGQPPENRLFTLHPLTGEPVAEVTR